jgi:hypothetical protein
MRRQQAERVDRPGRACVIAAAYDGTMSGDEPLLAECDRLPTSYRVGPAILPDICVRNSELLDI